MTMVRFEDTFDNWIAVNPLHVVSVSPTSVATHATLRMSNGADIHVKGEPRSVATALDKGLAQSPALEGK